MSSTGCRSWTMTRQEQKSEATEALCKAASRHLLRMLAVLLEVLVLISAPAPRSILRLYTVIVANDTCNATTVEHHFHFDGLLVQAERQALALAGRRKRFHDVLATVGKSKTHWCDEHFNTRNQRNSKK